MQFYKRNNADWKAVVLKGNFPALLLSSRDSRRAAYKKDRVREERGGSFHIEYKINGKMGWDYHHYSTPLYSRLL